MESQFNKFSAIEKIDEISQQLSESCVADILKSLKTQELLESSNKKINKKRINFINLESKLIKEDTNSVDDNTLILENIYKNKTNIKNLKSFKVVNSEYNTSKNFKNNINQMKENSMDEILTNEENNQSLRNKRCKISNTSSAYFEIKSIENNNHNEYEENENIIKKKNKQKNIYKKILMKKIIM